MTGRKQVAILSVLTGVLALMATTSAAPTVYPHGVTIHEAGVAEGHVIFGGQDGLVHLIDASGADVHTWTFPCGFSYVQRPLENGHVLTKSCGKLMELDWDSNLVWELRQPPGVEFHHDWERLPNGNTMVLCRQTIHEPSISDEDIVEDFILEVSQAGDVVWEWHEADHFGEFGFSQERIDTIHARGGDWSHATTLSRIPESTTHTDPRFAPGNILLGLRNQNTLAVIDRVTGQIVWTETDYAIGPHTAYFIPSDLDGGNNILVFDNGDAGDWFLYNRTHSRVLETRPDNGGHPYTYIDQDSGLRNDSFYSHVDGGAQRQSNGNTLITEASFGRIFEVTSSDELIWEYISPHFNTGNSNTVYRAYKMPLDWAGTYFVPDLVVSGNHEGGPVRGGGELDYTIRVENTGADPAVSVELAVATPPDAVFRSISAPPDWNCSTPSAGDTGPISCTTSSLRTVSAALFTLVLDAGPCNGDGTTVVNTATASSLGGDATPGDNAIMIDTRTDCPSRAR